jgi:hypothetical protein
MENVLIQLADMSDIEKSVFRFVTEDTLFTTSEFAIFWITAVG